jgi:hypothetical protein
MDWRPSCTRRIFDASKSDLLEAGPDVTDRVTMHIEFYTDSDIPQALSHKQQGTTSSCKT